MSLQHKIDLVHTVRRSAGGVFPNTHMSTMEISAIARATAKECGFDVKVSADYGGVRLEAKERRSSELALAMDRMKDGQTDTHTMSDLREIMDARRIATQRNDTGLVEFTIVLDGDCFSVTRRDIWQPGDALQTKNDLSALKATGQHVYTATEGAQERTLRKDLLKLSIIDHRRYAAVRLSATEILVFALESEAA